MNFRALWSPLRTVVGMVLPEVKKIVTKEFEYAVNEYFQYRFESVQEDVETYGLELAAKLRAIAAEQTMIVRALDAQVSLAMVQQDRLQKYQQLLSIAEEALAVYAPAAELAKLKLVESSLLGSTTAVRTAPAQEELPLELPEYELVPTPVLAPTQEFQQPEEDEGTSDTPPKSLKASTISMPVLGTASAPTTRIKLRPMK